MYSQYEILARDRIRERRDRAAHARLLRELGAGRRWQWLANFSARRAARSRDRAPHATASDFQLVG